jgi:hypothetical protein
MSKSAKERYQEYLKSPEWQELRLAALARAKGECEFCGLKGTAVHHIKYPKNLKEEDSLDNLVVVCEKCHSRLHGILGNEAGVTVDVTAVIKEIKNTHFVLKSIRKQLMRRWEDLEVRVVRLDKMIADLGPTKSPEVLNQLQYEKQLFEEEQAFLFQFLYGW